jgi:hypothetical protein
MPSEKGESIEFSVSNLVDLDAEAIFEPLRYEMSMAPGFARVAVGR